MPNVSLPSSEIYQVMGKDHIAKMIEAVYFGLAQSPIASMFPSDPEELVLAAQKSSLFWVTACGGPPLFEQKYGPPRMRARHLNFAIDHEARQAWLDCWYPVLARAHSDFSFPQQHMDGFVAYLEDFSLWMINR